MKKQIFNLEFSKYKQQENKDCKYEHQTASFSTNHFKNILSPYKGLNKPYQKPAIVIDNGSYECRAGWSMNCDDGPWIRFKNFSSKPKNFSGSGNLTKQMNDMILVGNELLDFDTTRENIRKSAFDKNVVYQKPIFESTLDYIFSNIGLIGDSSIDYPVMMTEPLCNPNYSRSMTSELLFECYGVPALSYGVDSMMAMYGSNSNQKDALIIQSSNQSSHVIPILNGQVQLPLTKRVSLGGSHSTDLLQKSLSYKFPQHRQHFSLETVQEVQRKYTEVAKNYDSQLNYMGELHTEQRRLEIIAQLNKEGEEQKAIEQYSPQVLPKNTPTVKYKNRYDKASDSNKDESDIIKNENIIQLPWSVQRYQTENSALQEQKNEERKREQGKKLREMMEQKNIKKKQEMENQMNELKSLMTLDQNHVSLKEEFKRRDIKDHEECQGVIERIEVKLGLREKKVKSDNEKYDLVDTPDDLLTTEQVKKKRIQKMHKTCSENRDIRKQKMEAEQDRIDELKDEDRDLYIKGLYDRRQEILERGLKRKRLQEQISKRGSLVNKRRMQAMAGMIQINENENATHHHPSSEQNKKDKNDKFGMDDNDWDVYRSLNKDHQDEDEEDQEQIMSLEKQIADVDPNFMFTMLQANTKMPSEEDFQIRLHVDQFRSSEIIFQPSIIGVEQAGISEVLEMLLKKVSFEQKKKMLKYVLITGGNTKVKGFSERILRELRMQSDFGDPINIVHNYSQYASETNPFQQQKHLIGGEIPLINDCSLDAWRGAAKFANDKFSKEQIWKNCISKKDYEEMGSHYLREHYCSNINYN